MPTYQDQATSEAVVTWAGSFRQDIPVDYVERDADSNEVVTLVLTADDGEEFEFERTKTPDLFREVNGLASARFVDHDPPWVRD